MLGPVVLSHIFCMFFMTGLCWFVQIVHYPLFKHIDRENFPSYQRKNFGTAYLAIPVMIIELISGIWLLYLSDAYLLLINLVLFALIGISTIIYQVPLHLELMNKPNSKSFNLLIRTNWIRTGLWTIRCIIIILFITENF